MRFILFVICLVISGQSQALEIKELFDKATSKLHEIMGETKEVKETITLPPIVQVKENATSIEVYNKSAPIYKQGKKFNDLTLEQKRKFRIAFLQELNRIVRSEEVSNEKLVSQLNVLEQGGTREGVYRSLVLDQVYSSLESYEEPSSDKLLDFTANFGEKFLRRNFSKDAMSKLNLWSIKRITTEKGLELLDAMNSNEQHIYRWYAVFSENIATSYPSLWKTKLRSSTNRLVHYKWAQSVPFQQIKSEFIIKLHTVMNFLQGQN